MRRPKIEASIARLMRQPPNRAVAYPTTDPHVKRTVDMRNNTPRAPLLAPSACPPSGGLIHRRNSTNPIPEKGPSIAAIPIAATSRATRMATAMQRRGVNRRGRTDSDPEARASGALPPEITTFTESTDCADRPKLLDRLKQDAPNIGCRHVAVAHPVVKLVPELDRHGVMDV